MKANSLVIILFSFLFLNFTITNLSVGQINMTIIIVDNEGDGDYISIKEALANAAPGDTIEVYSGTYNEYWIKIKIDNLRIKGMSYELGNGNDTGMPIIDGQGIGEDVFNIEYCKNLSISGLKIKNKLSQKPCTLIGGSDSENIEIKNNILENTSMSILGFVRCQNIFIIDNVICNSYARHGISISHSSNCIIIDNIIENNAMEGIELLASNDCMIINNFISKSGDCGLLINGKRNNVEHNQLERNNYGFGVYNTDNIIRENNIIENKNNAFFQYGLDIFPFMNNWEYNYWDRPRILPYPIMGSVFVFVPWVQFDWRPALQPHQI